MAITDVAVNAAPSSQSVAIEPSPGPRLVLATDAEPPIASDVSSGPIQLSEVPETSYQRDACGVEAFDSVLGGGLVVGSAVVLGGEPGCGKSTLLLQALDGLRMRVLYATGEESVPQAAGRAHRIDAASPLIWIVAESDLATVLKHARAIKAEVVAIDSVQTLTCSDLRGGAGSISQVKTCTSRLVNFAKSEGIAVILIAHVTGDGEIAGPKTLLHLVDVVLEFENGAGADGTERLLRCVGKNRFGPTNIVGHLAMTSTGLVPYVHRDEPEDRDLT